ncbi:MAG: SHOCT domain-containing protein [Marmoricola sp.]
MVIFWSLVILAVAMIFRGNRNDNRGTGTPRLDPMDILDERFARGEIDAEEYHSRRDALRRVS